MKNTIFDWSGVISDNIDDHVNHISYLFVKKGGKKITKRELREKWVQPYMKFYNQYFPEWSLKEHQKRYTETAHKFTTRKIYKGMKELLEDLKNKNYKLYVISGYSPKNLFAELKEYKLENIFNKVIAHSHDKKDDLIKLIKDEKLNRAQTYFVGDTAHEIECAKAAKIKSVAVTWGIYTPARLKVADPDFLVSNIKQLHKILFSRRS